MTRRLAYLMLAALVLKGGSGVVAVNGSGARPVPNYTERLIGPQAPLTQNVIYLPTITKNYVPVYVSPFGIDMYGGDSDADGRVQMQAAGSGWVTVHFSWSLVEPYAPVNGVHAYDWSSFDATVAQANAAGMNVLFCLPTIRPGRPASVGVRFTLLMSRT